MQQMVIEVIVQVVRVSLTTLQHDPVGWEKWIEVT